MEELLNKLIEKGWRPLREYNWPNKPFIRLYKDRTHWIQFYYNEWRDWDYRLQKVFSLRDIVSKESNLWQFVCENEMVFIPEWEIPYVERNYVFDYECYDVSEFQYWLMVWALLKEDEIEQFLLDNIKIDE